MLLWGGGEEEGLDLGLWGCSCCRCCSSGSGSSVMIAMVDAVSLKVETTFEALSESYGDNIMGVVVGVSNSEVTFFKKKTNIFNLFFFS